MEVASSFAELLADASDVTTVDSVGKSGAPLQRMRPVVWAVTTASDVTRSGKRFS